MLSYGSVFLSRKWCFEWGCDHFCDRFGGRSCRVHMRVNERLDRGGKPRLGNGRLGV